MWRVEVWVKQSRTWRYVGKAETFDKAKESVILIAGQYGVAQAKDRDAKPDEVRMIRAFKGKGFWYHTGSGGLMG